MARDVEINATLSDKTGSGLASVERRMAKTSKNAEKQGKQLESKLATSLVGAVSKISPKLGENLTSVFSAASESAAPALAAGAVVAAPFIAATLSAAIIGAAGVGGVVGGALLASKDARLKVAGSQLADTIGHQLTQDAGVMVKPLLKGVDDVGDAFETKLEPRLANIFRNSANYVDPLVDGVTGLADGVLRGVDALVSQAGPVMAQLGQSLDDIGDATGDMLTTISKGSGGAAAALGDITDLIVGVERVTGPTILGLTKLYEVFDELGATSGVIQTLGTVMGGTSKATHTFVSATAGAASTMQEATDDTYDYTAGMQQAEAAVQGVYQANRDLYGSTTDVAGAFAKANESIKENGKTLNTNTEKGRENRDAIAQVAAAIQRQYDNYVKVNGAGAGASALAGQLRGKFIALAEKMGLSASKAAALANELLGIPNVNRKVNVATEEAKRHAQELKDKLAGIKDRSVYVNVAFNEGRIAKVENQLARLHGSGVYAASTGSFEPGSGGARTGGAQQIALTNELTVNLDGRPLQRRVDTSIARNNKRQAWRARVGSR